MKKALEFVFIGFAVQATIIFNRNSAHLGDRELVYGVMTVWIALYLAKDFLLGIVLNLKKGFFK
jgi:hypothetical protein